MQSQRHRLLVDNIKRLLRRGASSHLKKIVGKTHMADLAVVFRYIPVDQQLLLLAMIEDLEDLGMLFSELSEDIFLTLSDSLPPSRLVEIFKHMPSDDVADLIGKLPSELADSILDKMKSEESEELESLLSYDDDTAGGIMVPDYIALHAEMTAGEAIASLQQEHLEVEMPFYLYVVDDLDRLMGVCSLRQLVVVSPDTPLKNFMTTEIFSVRTDMDQEEVAKIVARYNFLAVPVVNENSKLVGIVTVDDVLDIVLQEATEDILKMAGAGEKFVETQSVGSSIKIRLPWLFASCIGGVVASFVIGHYESILLRYAGLAAFIPVIMGMGGNIGTQSSTIVVRGLATGRLHVQQLWSVVAKELGIGLALGITYGLLIGVIAQFGFGQEMPKIWFAASVGLAIVSSMSVAALIGSFVPMVLAKFKIDPAVATGPFVTTAIDIVSIFFYFSLATILFNL